MTAVFPLGPSRICRCPSRSPFLLTVASSRSANRSLRPRVPKGAVRRRVHDGGLIRVYDVDGQSYAKIVGGQEHQRIDKPRASTIPPPSGKPREASRMVANGREWSLRTRTRTRTSIWIRTIYVGKTRRSHPSAHPNSPPTTASSRAASLDIPPDCSWPAPYSVLREQADAR